MTNFLPNFIKFTPQNFQVSVLFKKPIYQVPLTDLKDFPDYIQKATGPFLYSDQIWDFTAQSFNVAGQTLRITQRHNLTFINGNVSALDDDLFALALKFFFKEHKHPHLDIKDNNLWGIDFILERAIFKDTVHYESAIFELLRKLHTCINTVPLFTQNLKSWEEVYSFYRKILKSQADFFLATEHLLPSIVSMQMVQKELAIYITQNNSFNVCEIFTASTSIKDLLESRQGKDALTSTNILADNAIIHFSNYCKPFDCILKELEMTTT